MHYTIKHIAEIIKAHVSAGNDAGIDYLLTDSRKIVFPERSVFFAISGARRDGHSFIKEVYDRGVRNFVVKKGYNGSDFADAVFLQVPDVINALQHLAAFHRSRFDIPVIGITGSNGKTMVKEWLYQLLRNDYNIVRSPRSFNSQIGVPLSVWQMNEHHTLGIFEAGISTVDEMDKLSAIIRPTIGVFTNLGEAHNEGFSDKKQKAIEKAKLFQQASSVIYSPDSFEENIFTTDKNISLFPAAKMFSWSRGKEATLHILLQEEIAGFTDIHAIFREDAISVRIPFTDKVSIDNAITCWAVMLQLGYQNDLIRQRILQLEAVDMRMQLKKAINNCYLINDSYSNDLASLGLAIDYLEQQAGKQKTTLILSDILQSGLPEETLYREIAQLLISRGIKKFIGIGPLLSQYHKLFETGFENGYSCYASTEDFLQQVNTQHFRDEYILLKGARVFELERISRWLEQKVHQTVMEIDLTAMVHNLKAYQQLLKPSTRLMAMVKAFSYGSGSAEVARILQFHKIDYLAVAYADEGVELRKAGISLPIMVMNIDEAGFDALLNYNLEPEIYSFPLYHSFHHYLNQQAIQTFPVHIKFNTGMNRLGFETSEAAALAEQLSIHQTMAVKSVFSHLVASEQALHDGFTTQQTVLFTEACEQLQQKLGYPFIRHIANSAAILRNPQYQFDMVRLGIGLYGVNSTETNELQLQTVATLKTTIAQLRHVKTGESVGYGRKGMLTKDSRIATIRIGYADGYSRRLGNGVGAVFLHGKQAPLVGDICMDMAMIDVTDISEVKEGDEVEIFGPHLPVQQIAKWAGTIPYEIMTGISQRVKRIYLEE